MQLGVYNLGLLKVVLRVNITPNNKISISTCCALLLLLFTLQSLPEPKMSQVIKTNCIHVKKSKSFIQSINQSAVLYFNFYDPKEVK